MNAEELKRELKKVFGEQLTFNKEFDIYDETIKNIEESLIEWCNLVKEGKIKDTKEEKK